MAATRAGRLPGHHLIAVSDRQPFALRYCRTLLGLLLFPVSLSAQELPPPPVAEPLAVESEVRVELPSIMSLGQSLELADERHPTLLRHTALVQAGQALLQRNELDDRWKFDLELTARTADLQITRQGYVDDSRAIFTISKLVWDFGKSAQQDEIARLGVHSAELGLEYARRLQRIQIIKQYFEVLAADYRYLADNEAMTLAYFPFSRAQERQERFDSVSELEVLKNQVDYFDELARRNQSRADQRASRHRLALAMGLPEAKPDALLDPDLSGYQRELPDFDQLLAQVLETSPLLSQKKIELAQLRAEESDLDAGETPDLVFDVQLADYSQDYRARDRGRASLSLRVPLFAGTVTAVERAELLAEISAKEAELLNLEYEIREQVMQWVQDLEILNQQIEQNAQNLEYRERALDKSRMLYEMEVKAEIGQAQADMARLIWQDAQAKYNRALIWEQIDAILGVPEVRFD